MSQAVIVTGATRGVGRAVAEALAASGNRLVVNGRDAGALERLTEELGRRTEVVGVAGSVAEEPVAAGLVDACLDAFGRVDGLVNNAGIVRDRTTLRMTVEEFDDVVAVNLRGAWLCGRRAAEAMRANGGGSIVNVVSEVAFYGAVGQSTYMASKAGLVALTLGWAQELGRYDISVNGFSPVALTDMSRVVLEQARSASPESSGLEARDLGIGSPAEMTSLVLHLLSPEARDVTGQVFSFDGREISLWSFPSVASTVTADQWDHVAVAAALRDGRLTLQQPNPRRRGPA